MVPVSVFVFLFYLICHRSMVRALEKMDQKYAQSSNLHPDYTVTWMGWSLFSIIQTRRLAKEVLQGAVGLTYVNRNFFASHGHVMGIGNIDAIAKPELWRWV